jgi:hypothetical protein
MSAVANGPDDNQYAIWLSHQELVTAVRFTIRAILHGSRPIDRIHVSHLGSTSFRGLLFVCHQLIHFLTFFNTSHMK